MELVEEGRANRLLPPSLRMSDVTAPGRHYWKMGEGQNGREESRTTCCSPEPGSHASPAKGDLLPIFLLQVVEKGQVNTQQLPKPKESLEDFECAWKREERDPWENQRLLTHPRPMDHKGSMCSLQTRGWDLLL